MQGVRIAELAVDCYPAAEMLRRSVHSWGLTPWTNTEGYSPLKTYGMNGKF